MIQKYEFYGEEAFYFDDQKSVKELIRYAFEKFDYYEPLGFDIVTIFQPHHSRANVGWFTTDTEKSCAEEIENKSELFFAYHKQDVFYFAEGGWGHHMTDITNKPEIKNPVALNLRFEDFDHTVVFCGDITMRNIIDLFIKAGYIDSKADHLRIQIINPYMDPIYISFSDNRLDLDLISFKKSLPNAVAIINI